MIGSRQAPEQILTLFKLLGAWCRTNLHTATSGHADGVDYAAEIGAREACIVYLPWPTFNREKPMLGKPVVIRDDNLALDELVDKFHPAPKRLSRGARALMRRNGAQVLGERLDEPVDGIVCWTPKKGGTTQALRIAEAYRIPVLNLYNWTEEQLEASDITDRLIEAVKALTSNPQPEPWAEELVLS